MIVSDLIAQLQTMDPNAKIQLSVPVDGHNPFDAVEIQIIKNPSTVIIVGDNP
jgi:hypothetical protein